MAEPGSYNFELREVITALIKQQGLHEGLWVFGVEFQFAVGTFGPTPADARPGVILQIGKVTLARKEAATPDELAVDAAVVNPAPAASQSIPPRPPKRAAK